MADVVLRALKVVLWASLLMAGGSRLPAQDDAFDRDRVDASPPTTAINPITVDAHFTIDSDGQSGLLAITAHLAPGWHTYSITQRDGGPIRTKIELAAGAQVKLASEFMPARSPKVHFDAQLYRGLPLEEHEGNVTWTAVIMPNAGVDLRELTIAGKLTAQACKTQCLPPRDYPFSAVLMRADKASVLTPREAEQADFQPIVEAGRSSLVITLGLAFVGGLLLNLMPCVLPVIGLKLLAFLEQTGHDRRRVFVLNLWYCVGLMSVFAVLATLATFLGWRWGEQFTSAGFTITMASVVFVLALSFLGVWEIPVPGFVGAGRGTELAAREGAVGAFAKGVLSTTLATPCSGPLLGSVFGFTLGQPTWAVYAIFGSVGLGMASPYLIIGAFPALVAFLPKPGAWMDTFKQAMGFVLLGTVVWLFNSIDRDYFIPSFAFLIGLWAAFWLIGRMPAYAELPQKAWTWAAGMAIALVAGYVSFGLLTPRPELFAWHPFSIHTLNAEMDAGKTVLLDFTADWCPNCKLNEAFALNTPEVRDLVAEYDVVTLRADWTRPSEEIKSALEKLHSASIPLCAIFPSNRPTHPILLPDLITKHQVVEALRKAGPSKTPAGRVAEKVSRIPQADSPSLPAKSTKGPGG